MNLRFYRDPATGELHIYNHGVSENEVADVIHRPGEDKNEAKQIPVRMG